MFCCVDNRKIVFKINSMQRAIIAEAAAIKLINPLVWIDMEMSGLNLEKDKTLEIAGKETLCIEI